MNEEYLKGLHSHLGIKDDYETWLSAVKDNEEYLKGLHGHLGVKDDYDTWHTAVLGKKKDSTESVSTGEEEPTPTDSKSDTSTPASEVPVPTTILEGMERFKETGKAVEEPALGSKEAEKPKEKVEGSSVLVESLFTEESAKYREAQDALIEYDKLFKEKETKGLGFGGTGKTFKFTDAEDMTEEELEYEKKQAVRKAGEALGMDFFDKDYEEVKRIVNGGKSYAEQVLSENTLEKAKEAELKDPTMLGLTRTAFWDSFVDKPVKEIGIRIAAARDDYQEVERLQQEINERANRTQLSLGIDPTDERGITETFEDGDVGDAIYKGLYGAANSAGGLMLTIAAPNVGIAYFGTTSYASTYNSYIDRGDLTWEQKESLALIAGATEVAVGKFMGGLNNVKRFRNAVGIGDDIGKATMQQQRAAYTKAMDFLEPYGKKFTDVMRSPAVRGVTSTAYDTASEAIEEGVVELINQTAAHIIANDEYDAYAVYDSMILGAAMGAPMGSVTGFNNYRAINSIYKKPLAEDMEKYEGLQAQYKDLKQAMKEESDPQKKSIIREYAQETRKEIRDILNKANESYNKLNDKEAIELYNLNKQVDVLSRQAKEAKDPAVKKVIGNKIAGALIKKGELEAKAGIKPSTETITEPTGATETAFTPSGDTSREGDFQEIKAAQEQAVKDASERLSEDSTPKQILNKRGRYMNKADNTFVEGVVAKDGQTLVIETDEGNIIEIGNYNELENTPLRDIGLDDAKPVISANADGSFTYNSVAGAAPQGTNMIPSKENLKSIKRDKNGNIKRVVMKSPDGSKTYNLTGQDAQDVAYQMYLKEMQTEEGINKIESEFEQDEEARRILEAAERANQPSKKTDEATEGEAVRDTDKADEKQSGRGVDQPRVEAIGMKLKPNEFKFLDRVTKVLAYAVPNVRVVVHKSRDSYNETYEGAARSNGHYNPNTKTIHFLAEDGNILSKSNKNLVRHEAIHPIVDAVLQHSPEAAARAARSVRAILKRMGDNANAQSVLRHEAKYNGKEQEVKDIELVTEFFATFSDSTAIEEAKKSEPKFLERVGDLLTRIMRTVGLFDGKTKLESEKEIRNLMGELEFAFATGKTVRTYRHRNIGDAKKAQIRESISNIGNPPYRPSKGADIESVLKGWKESGSNFIVAKDLEHSFELRRMGFHESHQSKNGEIVLGKGVKYETYDAANNVAKIHPKSFISKDSITGSKEKKVAETLSAFGKFIKADVKFIDRKDLPFTSTLIVPDSENGLKELTPVVNLAYANARTGASGFSSFIVEAVRRASPVTINEVLMEMESKSPEMHSIFKMYQNSYAELELSPSRDLAKEDIEFVAFGRLLQESIDRVLTGAIDGNYAQFAQDMQKAFSDVVSEKGTQPSAKNSKNEFYVDIMPFGEDFVPALKSMFVDKKIEFQESLKRGKDLAKDIIDRFADILGNRANQDAVNEKKALDMIIAIEAERLNILDWIAIHTQGEFEHPAMQMIINGQGLPSIHENYEYVADELGGFYVSLHNVISDPSSLRTIEKAYFNEGVKLSEDQEIVLDVIKNYSAQVSDGFRKTLFDTDNKVFKPMVMNFLSDVSSGLNFQEVAIALGIDSAIVSTSKESDGAMELIREASFKALGGSREGLASNISFFLENNVFEKVVDALPALIDMIPVVDSDISGKVRNMSNPVEALNVVTKEAGWIKANEAFRKRIPYKELKSKIESIHPKGLPEGLDILMNESTVLEISVNMDSNGLLEVAYGFEYKANGGIQEYADYPNNWRIGNITMPLVFDAVAEVSGITNAKGITFRAVENAASKNIPEKHYPTSQLESLKSRKQLRHKRRGLNNLAAFSKGKIVNARKGREVAFYFEDGDNDNVVYITKDERILSIASTLLDLEGRSGTPVAELLGRKIQENREVFKLFKDGEIKVKEKSFSKEGAYMRSVWNEADKINSISYVFENAETIENTGVLSSTFENSQKYVSPAVIRESLAEGVTGEEALDAVDNMFAASEQHIIDASKSKKWNWKYITSRKAWVDRNAALKKAMANGFSQYISALNVNRAGATSYADRRFRKVSKEIYGKITNSEREYLDQYIFMRRVIDIDNTWIERKAVYTSRLELEISQIEYYERELAAAKEAGDKALIKEIEADIKESKGKVKYFESQVQKYAETPAHPTYGDVEMNKDAAQKALDKLAAKIPSETMALIEERADKYFDTYKQLLQEQYEEGLIDLETRDRFINNDYSPRQFLSKMFGNVDDVVFQQAGGLNQPQIQSIRSGADTGIFTDTEYMLDLSFRALENKKAKNKLFKEMHKEAKRKGFENIASGQFIREGNAKKDKSGKIKLDGFGNQVLEAADKNFVNVYYREGGKLRGFQIHKDYHSQLIGIKTYMLPPRVRNVIRWVSGTQIVKATATALNPFFAITGTLRGFREVTRGRGIYDKYRFLPLMNAMVFVDFVKSSKDAVLNTDLVEEYYKYGGGMSFMTTQGKPDKLYQKKRKFGIDFLQRRGISLNPFNALAFAGEKAELALRLAIYQRTKQNLQESMPDATQDEINSIAASEARLIADFAQGGELSSELDVFKPYLNASIQGTRASYDYMRKNPYKFFEKQTQAYVLNTALAMFARMMLWDDEEDKDWYGNISPWILERYNVIPTGLKNSLGEPITIRIPKVHQFLMFDSLSEITAKNLTYVMKDKEAPKDDLNPDGDAWFFLESLTASFPAGEFIPVSDIRKGRNVVTAIGQRMFGAIPIAGALTAYKGNYDLFRDKIISYTKDEVMPYAEGYKDKNVHDIYKFFGEITAGLGRGSISPSRAEVAVEKIIGSESTLLTALLYQLTDKFITLKEEKQGITPEKANKEFKNLFGFGKSFLYTIPKDAYKEKSDIEELINMEAMTTHYKIKKDIRLAAEKYTLDELRVMGESGKLPKEVTEFINSIDEPMPVKKYYLKYFKNVAMGNAVDDDSYFHIKNAKTPKAEMELFFHYFGDPSELTRDEKVEIQQNLQLIGYQFSEQTKSYYPKMKQN